MKRWYEHLRMVRPQGTRRQRGAEPRVRAVALAAALWTLARPPHWRDDAFTANAKRREMRSNRVGDVRRSQMRVVLFGHPGVGMAELLGNNPHWHALHGEH